MTTSPSNGEGSLLPAWYLPVLLCSEQASTADGPHPLDRIRMQKAVFLVTQQSSMPWHRYEYEPYNWGPYSQDLSDDLQDCQSARLVTLSFASGARYGRYLLTPDGQAAVDMVWNSLPKRTTDYLQAVRAWVTSKDFNSLLRDVYDEYPSYATKSRWRHRGEG